MDRRLDALLSLERLEHASAPRRAWMSMQSWVRMPRFYWMDVRPAIRAHLRAPRADVIGHPLEHDYNDMEVLIECITYGDAGMATTREFLGMAAWHLLEQDALRAEYLASGEAARHRILQEILRLEPVVGKLYRRTTEAIQLDVDGVHRCTGASIAIQETDVLLTRLLRLPLRLPLRMVSAPRLAWNDLIESYEVRGFTVEVEPTKGSVGNWSREADVP